MTISNLVLKFHAPDRPGILAAVGAAIAEKGCDIREAEVYGDDDTGGFFLRMGLTSPLGRDLDWELHDLARRTPVLLAVSKFGHCLVDIIHKKEIGQLPIDIVGVVSNHDTMRKAVEWHGIPYHHLPMSEGKDAQEGRFLSIIEESGAELTVLARYMQILSDRLSERLNGR